MSGINFNPLADVWSLRANAFGERCVVDLAISEAEQTDMLGFQNRVIMPVLLRNLRGDEQTVLDFGCGPGRFTNTLAYLIPTAKAVVGFDPCLELIKIANDKPKASTIQYVGDDPRELFKHFVRYFDVIWISLVLGGLPESILRPLARELFVMLAPGGKLILSEHISDFDQGSDFWRFYPERYYLDLFSPLSLRREESYTTRGNVVGVFTGHKPRTG